MIKCNFCDKTKLWMIKTLMQNGSLGDNRPDIKYCWTCVECFKNELMRDESYEW